MSRYEEVAKLVIARGSADADDLLPHFPGCTRKQVQKSLQNSKYRGLLSVQRRRKHAPAVFVPPEPKETHVQLAARVNSVWALGAQE